MILYLQRLSARVAQLVERQPSKLNVAGSNPVSRSFFMPFFKETKFKEYNTLTVILTSLLLVVGIIFLFLNNED